MAIRLPIYERQVNNAPLQAPQVQAATSAQGLDALGRGLQQAGNALGYLAYRQSAQDARDAAHADALRVDVAAKDLLQAKQQLLEDPNNGGFLATKFGEDAIKENQSYKDQFDNYAKVLAQKLSPSQRAAFEPIITSEATSFSHAVDQHTAQQSSQLDQQTSQAIFTSKANEAASAAARGDMGAMQDAISAGQGHLDELAHRNGWTQPIREAKEREYTSSARIGILETLLGSDQPDRAQQLLRQWGGELDQDKLNDTKLRQRIEGAVVKSQAQEVATTAWSISKNDVTAAQDAVDKADIKDPQVRDLARVLVAKQGDAYHDQQKAADSDGLSRIGELVARGRGKFAIADLDTNPDFLRFNLQDSRTKALQMVNAEARRASNDSAVRRIQAQIDAQAESEFRADAANDPDGALSVDIADKYANVSQTARNRIRERQGKLRDDVQSGEAVKTTEFMRMVNSRIGPNMSKDIAETIRDNMLTWHENRKAELKGKDPPLSEAAQYLNDQFTTVDSGSWFHKDRSRAESVARGWIPASDSAPAPQPTPQVRPKENPAAMVDMRAPDGRALKVPRSRVDEMLKKGATLQ